MSKKLNEDAMASELAGSAFFQAPASPNPVTRPNSEEAIPGMIMPLAVEPSAGADVRTPRSSTETTPAGPSVRPPVRRVITRYAFEFYQDQIEQLRSTALQQKLRGEPGSMSEMVREALDAFLGGKEGPAA